METISSAGAEGIAFNTSGNIRLSPGPVGHAVVEYAKNELAKPGSPTPMVTVSSTNFFRPHGVTFDNAGNLWAVSQGVSDPGTVTEFTKPKLDQPGSPPPQKVGGAGKHWTRRPARPRHRAVSPSSSARNTGRSAPTSG